MGWGSCFGVGTSLCLKHVLFFVCQIKLWALTLLSCFKLSLQQDRTEEIAHSTKSIWGSDLDVTWLKQPQLGPSRMEAKHRRSPTWWKLTLCKLNTKETQSSRIQEKPSMLETRTAKRNSGESSCNTVSDFRRPPGKVESPRSCGWKDKMTNKILIPIQPLISCLLKCPVNRWVAVGATEGLRQGLLPNVSRKLYYPLHPSSYWQRRWGFFCP